MTAPTHEKGHPIFPSKPPLKIEILSSEAPLFENLVGGSTFPQYKGGMHTMLSNIIRIFFIFVQLRFTPHRAEQTLQGMKLQEKKQKDEKHTGKL